MVKKTTTKKKYIPNSRKNICAQNTRNFHRRAFKLERDIIKANNLGNLLNSSDDNVSSADMLIKHHTLINL